jgi:hypothetical protein
MLHRNTNPLYGSVLREVKGFRLRVSRMFLRGTLRGGIDGTRNRNGGQTRAATADLRRGMKRKGNWLKWQREYC